MDPDQHAPLEIYIVFIIEYASGFILFSDDFICGSSTVRARLSSWYVNLFFGTSIFFFSEVHNGHLFVPGQVSNVAFSPPLPPTPINDTTFELSVF